jgi:hypothetical protein
MQKRIFDMKKIEKLYAIIRKAEEEIREIRAACKHKKHHVGLYSSRPGDLHNAKICDACGEHLGIVYDGTLPDLLDGGLYEVMNENPN